MKIFALLLMSLLATSALSQWSSDPSVNLAVCDTSGSQELPKIVNTSDGGCYISWFDTRGGAYRVYMQRSNAQGVKQWDPNGILISSNPQNTSLVDYDLAVDDSNYAVVVFTDIRNGGQIEPFAYRISPQGNFVWGANGITLSTSPSTFQPNPKVACSSDGNFVFAWIYSSTPRRIAMQKLNAAGVKQWGTDPILLAGTGTENLDYPGLVRSDNGSVILMNSGYTGTFVSPSNYRIYTQKYSSVGTPLWGSVPDTVYGLGRVSGFFVPRLIPDGSNGAFYVWHDDRNNTGSSFSHVQHVTSNNTKLFPVNGSAGSTLAGRLHNDAWVSYTPANGETYMFWYETNSSTQSVYGVYGQKFSSSGTRMWADSGVAFKSLAPSTQPSFIRTFAKDSAAVVYYIELISGTNRLIKGFKTDRSGNLLWGGTIKDVSSLSSDKGRLTGAFTSNGNSLLVWADKRLDGNGIYGQNVNFDGTLGVPPTPEWYVRASGTTAFLQTVKQVNINVIWTAGNGATVRRSTDGGVTWTNGNATPGVITGDIYNIEAIDANTALCTTSPAATFIYRTTNGGTTWTQVFMQQSGFINGIHMLSTIEGIAEGDPVGGKFTILRTMDGGATWNRTVTEPTPVGQEFGWNNSLSTVGTMYIWFGTSVGAVWRSSDRGATWARATTPGNTAAIHFNDITYGLAGEFRSTDGGVTWIAANIPGTGDVSGLSGAWSEFFASKGTSVYRSTDRGTTWAISYPGGIGTLSHLDFHEIGGNRAATAVSQTGGIVTYLPVVEDVATNEDLPARFSLNQNYPNPFNPSTIIRFQIPILNPQTAVSLKVFDVLGREVATLVNEIRPAGTYDVAFHANNLSSGVYFYRLQAMSADRQAGTYVETKRMLLIK